MIITKEVAVGRRTINKCRAQHSHQCEINSRIKANEVKRKSKKMLIGLIFQLFLNKNRFGIPTNDDS